MKRKNQLIENLKKENARLKAENAELKAKLKTPDFDIGSRLSRLKYIKEQTGCSLKIACDADTLWGQSIDKSIKYAQFEMKKQEISKQGDK